MHHFAYPISAMTIGVIATITAFVNDFSESSLWSMSTSNRILWGSIPATILGFGWLACMGIRAIMGV